MRNMSKPFIISPLIFLFPASFSSLPAQENHVQKSSGKSAAKAIRLDRVVAGGPKDFMEVRHVILKGANEEIGRALAAIAIERFKLKPEPSADRLRNRVQRRYFEKNYPIMFDRMCGVAAAFGKRVDDDNWNFSGLSYLVGAPGCSAVYYPPSRTADGRGVLSRNYDFGTGTKIGRAHV